jgi:maltoporin
LAQDDVLHAWFAAAYAAPGSGYALDTTTGKYDTPTDYEAAHGVAAGARWRHALSEKSYNDFTVMYGTGAMENFTMDNSIAYAKTGTHVNSRKRTRVVENPIIEFDKWSLAVGLIYEDADNGLDANTHSRWISAGIRPVYYFTDHYHLVFEAGHSSVKVDSDTGTGGAAVGERTLDRVTLAPEVAIGKGFFARPVIRAYVTHTWWNKANQDVGNTDSLVGALNANNITALNGKADETQVGVEAEVWF